jgi:3-methyl-2-oxobutanoate hydroxymethyltransferase
MLLKNAEALQEAGCFSLVLEKIPAALGTEVAKRLKIPVIGIGAGGGVDGQVLVMHDMLGITKNFSPRFLRRYLNLYEDISNATAQYIKDVKSSDFPNEKEQY